MLSVYSGITSANYETIAHEVGEIGNSISAHARRTAGSSTDRAQLEISIVPVGSRGDTDWFDSGVGDFEAERAACTPEGVVIQAIRLRPSAGTWEMKVREGTNSTIAEA